MPAQANNKSMQTSKRYKNNLSHIHMKESKSQLGPQTYNSSTPFSSDSISHQLKHASPPNYTLESSSTTYNSPSTTISVSPTSQSPVSYDSPVSASCITDGPNELQQKLRELETVVFGAELNCQVDTMSNLSLEQEDWMQMLGIPQGDLKQVLLACAQAVDENEIASAEWLIAQLRPMVSVSGEPIQRVGAYMLEALVARLASSGSSIYKILKCKEPASSDLLSYMHLLYEACPYFKFGYLSANGAIAEAFKGEDRVHIIDFMIAQGTQWVTLIRALAEMPGGPPHVRITGIDDSLSAYARGGGLNIVGQRLTQFAKACGVSLEFHPAIISGSEIDPPDLYVQPGEALAVNFAFQLHHISDESVSTMNHRDTVLRLVKNLSPKVVTLVEQESNTNTAPFYSRFVETLSYYTAIFESIDVTLPRDNKERINVEQHCLARDMVNIIACEGAERVERHELFGKWKSRFMMAGFTPVPLSPSVNATISSLLANYSDKFRLEERDGVLYLGWMNRALVVSCAWR